MLVFYPFLREAPSFSVADVSVSFHIPLAPLPWLPGPDPLIARSPERAWPMRWARLITDHRHCRLRSGQQIWAIRFRANCDYSVRLESQAQFAKPTTFQCRILINWCRISNSSRRRSPLYHQVDLLALH